MIKHYIIDGNNLIGKIKELKKIQKSNPQASRERLAFIIDRYFLLKPFTVTLHFDGFPKDAIKTEKVKIEYSFDKMADDMIKLEISNLKNPKSSAVVSSDFSVIDYARKSSCKTILSEEFRSSLNQNKNDMNEEEKIAKSISDDEIKKLFGIE